MHTKYNMRDLIDILTRLNEATEKPQETKYLKKAIVELLKGVDENSVLHKVLKTLQAGNIDKRIEDAVSHDKDAKAHIDTITNIIMKIDAEPEVKDKFLDRFKKGVVDTSKLLDKKLHHFSDLMGPGFPTEVFRKLCVAPALVPRGVGAGELAFAILNPNIKWTGKTGGGGDINVAGTPVELKTTVSSGGRWIDTKKSKMNVSGMVAALQQATGKEVPDRISVNNWVNYWRPLITNPADLEKVCDAMAKGLFTAVDSGKYKKALMTGSAEDITEAMLDTGYNNYKKLSHFDGILLMDMGSESVQYFTDYPSMKGLISVETPYVIAPEGEMMPKVTLSAGKTAGYGDYDVGGKKKKAAKLGEPTPSEKEFRNTAQNIATGRANKPIKAPPIDTSTNVEPNVGRAKRKR